MPYDSKNVHNCLEKEDNVLCVTGVKCTTNILQFFSSPFIVLIWLK
jgi:hypothetical protein